MEQITVKLKQCELSRIAESIYHSDYHKRYNYEAAKFAFYWQVKAARSYKTGIKRQCHINIMKDIVSNIERHHMAGIPVYIKRPIIDKFHSTIRFFEKGKTNGIHPISSTLHKNQRKGK